MENLFLIELNRILNSNQIKVKERMENHTSLHIGGEADYVVFPSSPDEIREVILLCGRTVLPYYVMGNGSNLLVQDCGFRGLVIKLAGNFSKVSVNEDGTVFAESGVLLSKLANIIAQHSLTGFEFASGIPGTLGGAVTMNAGAYDGEMKQYLVWAKVMDETGEISVLNNKQLELGYRSSILQRKKLVVLEAALKFTKGDKEQISSRMKELNLQRSKKQPLDQYSAGSTFKRPAGYYAGKLINDSGLKGYQVGDAAVSEKHCGFIINKGNASAEDFKCVMQDVIRIVEEKYGVRLEPEVKCLEEEKPDCREEDL